MKTAGHNQSLINHLAIPFWLVGSPLCPLVKHGQTSDHESTVNPVPKRSQSATPRQAEVDGRSICKWLSEASGVLRAQMTGIFQSFIDSLWLLVAYFQLFMVVELFGLWLLMCLKWRRTPPLWESGNTLFMIVYLVMNIRISRMIHVSCELPLNRDNNQWYILVAAQAHITKWLGKQAPLHLSSFRKSHCLGTDQIRLVVLKDPVDCWKALVHRFGSISSKWKPPTAWPTELTIMRWQALRWSNMSGVAIIGTPYLLKFDHHLLMIDGQYPWTIGLNRGTWPGFNQPSECPSDSQ